MFNFLSLCTGNSCRSILAEATFDALPLETLTRDKAALKAAMDRIYGIPLTPPKRIGDHP